MAGTKQGGIMSFNIYCCNPFEKDGHKTIKKLRPVQNWMIELNRSIKPGMKICDSCRKQLAKEGETQPMEKGEECEAGTSADKEFIDCNMSIEYLNKSLSCIEESPIVKKRMCSPAYCKRKLEKVKKNLVAKLVNNTGSSESEDNDPDSEILLQLKKKFEQTQSRSEKFQILTLLPMSWSCKKIENEFMVSNRMARRAKALVKEKGILSTPDPKPGKSLNDSVTEKVNNFYNSDDVSRVMLGKKDFVSLKTDHNTHDHVQKRLILSNLKHMNC